MQTVKDRLIEFLEYKDLSQAKFAGKIGVSKGYVNNMTENPTQETITSIKNKFPELNTEWLLTGKGEMLRNNINEVNGNGNTSVAGNGNQITTANIAEMLELQKGYQKMIKTSQEQLSESQSQISRLIAIIEQYNK
jgi:transcriptional regulator with XRE-family HTH domain